MPDCSKGMQSRQPTNSAQPVAGSSRHNRDRCRNCEVLEARMHRAKQALREVKRVLRRKVRELHHKRERMTLILLTAIDMCDQGSPKLNRRAIEEKIKNPAFMRENIYMANSIASLVNRYRWEADETESDNQEDEE